jgi:hypothetical protein
VPRIFQRKTSGFRRALALVIGCAAVAASASAGAYVRARSDAGAPLFWPEPRQTLAVARPPTSVMISNAELRGAAKAAINSWSYPNISCTAVWLRLEDGLTDSQVCGRDGTNRIIMRIDEWCRDPADTTKNCHDMNAVALTTVFSRMSPGLPDDGKILEADIEINAVNFGWTVIPDGPVSGRVDPNLYDLTAALTHETGHFIGLDHACLFQNPYQLTDDQGALAPDCGNLPPATQAQIEDATMYPLMSPADAGLKLRTLTEDDSRASCEIYPALVNEWGGGGGCAVSPAPVSSQEPVTPAVVTLLMVAQLLASRPSRRRDAFLAR